MVDYLTIEEMQAILDAPDLGNPFGIRDRAMIYLAYAAGLRASELVNMRLEQLQFNPSPVIHIHGKGRKERVIPLWKQTASALRAWIAVRAKTTTALEIFVNSQGYPITRSGFKYILSKYVEKKKKKLRYDC